MDALMVMPSGAAIWRFAVLMFLSSLIAAIGLLQNSVAVVIGAMMIAPLMAAIMGIATCLIMGWGARPPGRKVLEPALGGLAVGLITLVVPKVLASGYGWVRKALTAETLMSMPLWIVLILPLAKIVATWSSIGTGALGGIFSPGIVIGAFTELRSGDSRTTWACPTRRATRACSSLSR
jgi:H+/Cl- antiporter ClcA